MHVFMSYARNDEERATGVETRLRELGYVVWRDIHSLPGSQNWEQAVRHGIRESGAVVVLWSNAANLSEWVKKELRLAQDSANVDRIVTVLGDDTPLPSVLAKRQAIASDVSGRDLDSALVHALPDRLRRHRHSFELAVPLREQATSNRDTIRIDEGVSLLSLPLIESGYCRSSIVGHPDTAVTAPGNLHVCLQFSRSKNDPFVASVYRTWLRNTIDSSADPFVAIHVQGPHDPVRDAYSLDNENTAQWSDAVDTTLESIKVLSTTARPTLRVFALAPVALGIALGTRIYRFHHLQMYNYAGGDNYVRVIDIEPG